MTGTEYLNSIMSITPDDAIISRIDSLYSHNLPDIIYKIISNGNESIFLDDDIRMLSYEEIKDATHDLHVDFKAKGLIPIADCGENNFIVYSFIEKTWSKFNIVDEVLFKKKNNIDELLK